MQLGRTIIGAVIGAAISIGLLLAAHSAFGLDAFWLAIPVAILTGLGVRMMVATSGHASYLRGAVTGVLALTAYLIGSWVVAQVAQAQASKGSAPKGKDQVVATQPAETDKAADEAPDGDEPAEEPKAAPATTAARPASSAMRPNAQMPKGFQPLDFLWLSVAALIAYELGRGTAARSVPVEAEETVTEVPVGTHPDA